jgi:hypothetical protein
MSLSAEALAKVDAQQKKNVTVADFVGTWNIEMMSHQIALVIDPADGNKVTATMMMMNNDTPLKGELVGDTLTLTGVRKEGDEVPHAMPVNAKPIVVTMNEDGTIGGEMMTNQGPVKWTGELRARRVR